MVLSFPHPAHPRTTAKISNRRLGDARKRHAVPTLSDFFG